MPILKGLYDYLVADSGVTSRVTTYKGAPAVFTIDPAPPDAGTKMIVLTQVGGDRENSCRAHRGSGLRIDVRCWDDKSQSDKAVRELAFYLWEFLNWSKFPAVGYDVCSCFADTPQGIKDPDGFPGYVVPCRILVREE